MKKESEGISVAEVNHKIFRRFRKTGKSNYILASARLSVCPSARNVSAPTDRIFMTYDT
jgi:hypothetical protein